MGAHLSVEALERLAASAAPPARQDALRGPPAEDPEAQAHLRGCAVCARELAWLRAERLLVARRREGEGPLPASLWQGVLARISSQAGAAGDAASGAVGRSSRSRTLARWDAVRRLRWAPAPVRRTPAAFALAAAATAAAVVLAPPLRRPASCPAATGPPRALGLRDDPP